MAEKITVQTTVNAPIEKIWKCFTEPEHITKWNHVSDDWHSPRAENDLRPGGTFNYRMESVDGSQGFDFGGTYDEVVPNKLISYTIGDSRKVQTTFEQKSPQQTVVTTVFDAETQNSSEMQKAGWQAIFDNFKKHTESC